MEYFFRVKYNIGLGLRMMLNVNFNKKATVTCSSVLEFHSDIVQCFFFLTVGRTWEGEESRGGSPSHSVIIDTILLRKFFKKYFFQIIKNCSKINKIHVQELKMLRKTNFCNILLVLDQNDILKKKSAKICSKMQKFLRILKIQMSILWPHDLIGWTSAGPTVGLVSQSTQTKKNSPNTYQLKKKLKKTYSPQKGPFLGGGLNDFMCL